MRVGVPYASGFAQAQSFAQAVAIAASAISGCAIQHYVIQFKRKIPGNIPALGSDAYSLLCCVVSLQNGDKAIVVVPGPRPELFLVNALGQTLYVADMANPLIVAFAAALEGTQAWNNSPYISMDIAGLAY